MIRMSVILLAVTPSFVAAPSLENERRNEPKPSNFTLSPSINHLGNSIIRFEITFLTSPADKDETPERSLLKSFKVGLPVSFGEAYHFFSFVCGFGRSTTLNCNAILV